MAFYFLCPVGAFLKSYIMNVFHIFHAQAVFEKSLNASFIAFIPKKIDDLDMKDF